MVLESASNKGATIIDPALGRRKLDTETLRKSYSGMALIAKPGPALQQRRREPLWRNYAHLLLFRRQLWVTVAVLSVLLLLYGLSIPFIMRNLSNRIINGRDFDLLVMSIWALAAISISYATFVFLRARLLVKLQVGLDWHIMERFTKHLLALPFSFFQQRSVGDLVMRANTNARVREFVSVRVVSTALDSVLVGFFLALIFWQSLIFGAVVVVLLLVETVAILGTWERSLRLAREATATEARSQGYLAEVLQGVASLKVAGAEDRAFQRWADAYQEQLSVIERRGKLNAYVESLLGSVERLSPLLLLLVGLQLVLAGEESIGTVIALYIMSAAVLGPISNLLSTAQGLQLLSVNLERLNDVDTARPEQQNGAGRHVHLAGRVDVADVSFRYGPRQSDVLQRVDVSIEAGQKVAIVGPSGSGKSSLAMLLVGLYQPTRGRILYDGTDLAEIDYRTLRQQIGVVLQDAFVFGGTIEENISLHDPSMSKEDIVRAASLAAIHEEIMDMSLAYDTLLSEGAGNLSGGQRQRLAIARALAHRPSILLLDEATSDLDTLNEHRIDDGLTQLRCTRIVVAHRLSTVKNADQIIVLDQGKVVDQGKHTDLISRSILYRSLVAPQSQRRDTHADILSS